MKKMLFCIYLSMIFLNVPNVLAEVFFTDATNLSDLSNESFIYVNLGDYDNDGYIDIAASSSRGRRLYRNEGNGTFKDVTEITGAFGGGMNGIYFLDFDNDGNLDLFMSGNNTKGQSFEHGDRLLWNRGDGTFIDVSQKAGLDLNARIQKYINAEAFSFDFDNDGLLDIFVANGDCNPTIHNYLYHNEGNGRFKEMSAQIGLDDPRIDGVVPGDYNNDGRFDIFMTVNEIGDAFNPDPNNQGIDMLYRNEGKGIYVNVAEEAGVARNASHLSGFFFDYDNDGDLDLFLRALIYGDIYGYNILYRNNGDGTFTEVTKQAGILPINGEALGTEYGDYDNDGWLDICVTYQGGDFPFLLYHNNQDGTFTNVSAKVGVSSLNFNGIGIFMDYNNDGYLDILAYGNNTRLYRNEGTNNHWLQLKLVGKQSNRDAIGSRVKVITGEISMIREVVSASHHLHQERIPVHFGLGKNLKADVIEIRWPSGIVQTFTDIPADQRITIDEIDGIITILRQVIPNSGNPDGGTAVRIQGESFRPGLKVLFGGVEAKNIRVETPTLITAVAPPGKKGFADVEIINPDGSRALLKNGFRYISIQVTKITPDSGPTAGGKQIQIEGSGFQEGIKVSIGDNQLSNLFVTPVLLRGTLPAGISGLADVSLINPDGEVLTLKNSFTYISPPKIDKIYPKIVPLAFASRQIGIQGSDFIRTPSVLIGGIASQNVRFESIDRLEIQIPLGLTPGPQDILVINPDGQRAILHDGITVVAPPKIKSIQPSSGSLDGGTKITIIGGPSFEYGPQIYDTNLRHVKEIIIGKMECTDVKVESDYVVTAITPANIPGPKDVTIIDEVGQDDTLQNAFTYNAAPQITKVVPNNGRLAGGTNITIEGSGFMPGAEVIFRTKDGYAVLVKPVQFISSNAIATITPSMDPGVYDIMVRNPDEQFMLFPDAFTYNPIPTITRITPNYGSSSGGAKIVVEGTGFLPGVKLIIGENSATAQLRDNMTIEAIAPPNRQGVWHVRVINPDTQEAIMSNGFISVGELVYNYPNPFKVSQGTTFRYVTNESIQSITVRIFNLAGVPIDIVHQDNSNEVKWQNEDVHSGMYLYLMEVNLSNGEKKQFKKTLEVYK